MSGKMGGSNPPSCHGNTQEWGIFFLVNLFNLSGGGEEVFQPPELSLKHNWPSDCHSLLLTKHINLISCSS
jgi:hypothetical protein